MSRWFSLPVLVGEGIDQDWLIGWSMSRPLPGPIHNQAMALLKEDDVDEEDPDQINVDGGSPNVFRNAMRYQLAEKTVVERWEQDPNTGEWFQVGVDLMLL